MLQLINAEPWNQLAPGWALAMQAALIHGIVALAVVGSFWALFRRNMSHAFAHGLFLVVPIKAATAALFVAWPVAIAFTVPLPKPVLELIHPPNMLLPQAKPAIVSQIQSVDRLEDNPSPVPAIVFNDKLPEILPVQSLTIDEPVIQQADPVAIVESPRIKPPFSRWAVVVLAWLACVVMLTTICISNHMRMIRRLHFGHVDNLPANISRLQQISSKIGLRRSPLIWETSAVGTPAVIGLFRPRLLIPRDFFNDFTEDEIQWALLHELAHLRRLDLWWLALERAVGLALFFHPALWIARRATRHFRELACDDTAQIQSGLSPKACAEGFLKLVIWAGRHGQSPNTHTPALSLTDRYPAIQKRIMNMTAPNATHRCARLSRASATAIAALAILVSLPFSPTIVAQAPPVELEVVLNATDDKKPSETSVKQTRPNGFDKELAEIQKLSEQLNSSLPKLDSIKPLNTKAIPVNQPPHDGALIDFPNTINPPDILLVEVLEALPGRPIQGERLVQPDGTISLGFYGRLYVSGLTLDQIKIKLLIHLRQYLSDKALGLVEQAEGGEWKAVDPEKSAKLVVDLASNHSRFYYVQGAVEVPGRYPINGKETVIDAITIAKGLKDDADLTKFSLIRPSHGDEAPRKFTIDWKKISEEGDRKSNLQLFPGDRLIVQKKTNTEAVNATKINGIELIIEVANSEEAAGKPKSKQPFIYHGKVLLPDGSPSPNTRIGFCTKEDFPLMQGGIITRSQKSFKIPITDAQGNFELQTESPVQEWIVMGQKGSVRRAGNFKEDTNSLILQMVTGGGIQGHLLINGKLNIDTTVSVHYFKNADGLIDPGLITTVDSDGKYQFQGLVAGKAILEYKIGRPGELRPITRWQRVDIKSGELTTYDMNLKLADTQRRDLVGIIQVVAWPSSILHLDVNKTTFELRPLPGNPLRHDQTLNAKYYEARAKYLETPEGMFLNNILEEFLYVPRYRFPNLAFRLTDVPVGKYELFINTATYDGKQIGSARKIIEIPKRKAGEENQPIDLGNFRIDPKNPDGVANPKLSTTVSPDRAITSQNEAHGLLPRKIGGRVDDPNGKPISGAEIMFLYLADEPVVGFEPKRLPPVKTDTDGTFLIEILPGEFKYAFVQITRPGYASQHIPFNREDARYESFINNNAKIELTEGTTVKGKVYDPDGKPLAGAQVYYSPRMYFSDAHTSISGPNGEFSFENIDKEKPSQVFYAKKPGYGTATIKIARTNGIPSELKLQMTLVREFNATITDIQGKPIAGVVAELRLVNIFNGEYELRTTSDAEGKIKFNDLPKGKDIRVNFSRTEFAQNILFVKGDDLSEKHIQLLKGVTGSGLVRNSQTLQPINRFQVTLEPQNDQNTLRRNRETGDYRNGTFRLGATTFSPESFQLVIEAEGFKPFRTASYKLDECPVKLDVKLDPIPVAELPHYRGKIIQPDGKPAGRVKIGVVTDKDFPRIQKGQISWTQLGRKIPLTDENGDFDFHTPEPVRELLVLHDSGAIRQLVEPGMDLNKIQMQLQPYGRLAGSLKRNGKPDLQSRMFLIYQSIQPQFWQTYEQIVLKQDGTFSIDRMIPGNFKISFEPANIDENSRTNTMEAFSIKPGETVRLDRDLKLADVPRRDLVGKLQFPDGKIPGDLSLSRIILLAPEGNPLRGTPDNYISNSETRLKYRETAEGKALYQSLEEFPLLKKEVSTEGVFRISGLPAGRFELNILPGNANIIYGTAKKIIETTSLKPGELNQPVDLGEIMVERQVQKPPVKAENPKEAGAVNVKPVSTPTPNIKIGGVVVDETVKLNQVKSRK